LRVVVVDHVARLSGGESALRHLRPVLRNHVDVHVVREKGPLIEHRACRQDFAFWSSV